MIALNDGGVMRSYDFSELILGTSFFFFDRRFQFHHHLHHQEGGGCPGRSFWLERLPSSLSISFLKGHPSKVLWPFSAVVLSQLRVILPSAGYFLFHCANLHNLN